MSKTLLQLRTDLRDRLDEAQGTAIRWTDTQLNTWLNEGLLDTARRSETIQSTSTINAVVGTQQYALPTDTIRIYRVEWRPTSGSNVWTLEYRDFNNMDAVWYTGQTQIQSTPMLFTVWGFPPSLNMVTYPIPYEAGTFKVFYYKTPTVLSADNDVAQVPEGWADLAIPYAEAIALRKDRDPRWQESKNLYETTLTEMMDRTRRWSDQAGMMVPDVGPLPEWVWNEGWY